jgi:acyl carrier protein
MKDEVIQTIRDALCLGDTVITESTQFAQVAHDSLELLNVMLALSSKYDLVIDLKDIKDIRTVGDVADYVVKRHAETSANQLPSSRGNSSLAA